MIAHQVPIAPVTGQVRLCVGSQRGDARVDAPVGDGGAVAVRTAPGSAIVGLIALLGALLVTGFETLVFVIVVVATAVVLRRVAASMSFSFADGFLTYRGDAGWPHGVQEDDDFRWSWSRPSSAVAGTFRPPRARGPVG